MDAVVPTRTDGVEAFRRHLEAPRFDQRLNHPGVAGYSAS
jgi:hypothetical protein